MMWLSWSKAGIRWKQTQKRVLEDEAARLQQVPDIHLKQALGRGKTLEMELQ